MIPMLVDGYEVPEFPAPGRTLSEGEVLYLEDVVEARTDFDSALNDYVLVRPSMRREKVAHTDTVPPPRRVRR